jgi:hypothetical protein
VFRAKVVRSKQYPIDLTHNATIMLNCQQETELLSQAQDRPLTWKEKLAAYLHLAFCKSCRRFSRQLKTIKHLLSQYKKDQ